MVDLGTCPSCGATGTQQVRRHLTPSLLEWFRRGGRLFPQVLVCRACGHRQLGVGVFFGGPVSPWAQPWAAVLSVSRAFHGQRTAQPVPWLYAATAGLGAVAGAGVAAAVGRPVVRAAGVGAAAGAVTCWSAFAATAVGQHGTGTAVVDAVLVHAAPQRHAERLARREEEQAASADFDVHGLDGTWSGSRFLAGSSSQWRRGRKPPLVDSVTLGHTQSAAAAWEPDFDGGVRVTSRAPRAADDDAEHRWEQTPQEWAEQLRWELAPHRRRHGSDDDGAAQDHGAPAQHGDLVVTVEGRDVTGWTVRVADHWVVVLRSPDLDVEVRGSGDLPAPLRLARITDLSRYRSLLPRG